MGLIDLIFGIGVVRLIRKTRKDANKSREREERAREELERIECEIRREERRERREERREKITSLISNHRIKKQREREERELKAALEEEERKYKEAREREEHELKAAIEEQERRYKEAREKEERRKNTHCSFCDVISQEEFRSIALRAGKTIKRLTEISVDGPIVYGTVQSQSGISAWRFKADFNDFGHLTGRYWLSSDNHDSSIPSHVAEAIKLAIINRETDNDEKNTTGVRINDRNTPRSGVPCSFEDGISKYDFQQMVKTAIKKNERIEELKVFNAKVYGLIRSQTGKSSWRFMIDFNDNGHLTGQFRCFTKNEDSQISVYIGQAIKEAIQQRLSSLEGRQ